jgi:transcriptional regulator with XRE-family HTH domain
MMQESLARKLRVLRAERGITLQEAEELTGVTRETLGALEHGQRGAYTNTLQKIAEGYGITVGELLEEPVPLGKVPEVGRSEPAMEWREYKEVKALDESRDRELAQRYLTQTPSDAERIKDLEGNAGVLEGYVQRWDVELEYLTEMGKYPYGKGIETEVLFQRIAEALEESLLLPYAIWVTKERIEAVSERELAASKRLWEAVKRMSVFVERAQATERQMRLDQGEVRQGPAKLSRMHVLRERHAGIKKRAEERMEVIKTSA